MRQIGRYGLHRGFFAKKLPETSRKFNYFIPSLLVLFLVIGIPLTFMKHVVFNSFFITGIGLYICGLIFAFYEVQKREKNAAISLVSLSYIFLTHIWYGIRFLQGFILTSDLKSKLRK